MVVEQGVGMNPKVVLVDNVAGTVQECEAVFVVVEDIFPLVSPGEYVVTGAFVLYSGLSGHTRTLTQQKLKVKC
jgi:hypothetical protein